MDEHMPSYRLEAVVAGDSDPEATGHLAECAACREYVAALERELAAYRQDGADRKSLDAALADPLSRGAKVLRLAPYFGPPLLVAAGLIFYLGRLPKVAAPSGPDPTHSPTAGPIGPDTRFKGAAQVFVIVERAGRQQRVTGELGVVPGDQIRVEVSLAEPTPVAAGVLTSTGEYVPLLLAAELDAGTHFSERAATFDAERSRGWIIVGHPDAVAKARQDRVPTGVTAIPFSYLVDP